MSTSMFRAGTAATLLANQSDAEEQLIRISPLRAISLFPPDPWQNRALAILSTNPAPDPPLFLSLVRPRIETGGKQDPVVC